MLHKVIGDIEMMKGLFVFVGEDLDGVRHVFHLHSSHDITQIDPFITFCKTLALIGFNNRKYDGPVIQKLIDIRGKHRNSKLFLEELRAFSDTLINSDKHQFNRCHIPQFDLMKLHHYDNPAKRCSLKWLEFAFRSPHMQDLPFNPNDEITVDQIQTVIDYCHNDVTATVELYKRSTAEINMRKSLSTTYDLNLYDLSDSSMGSEILLSEYCKVVGDDPSDIRELKTSRNEIVVKDILLPYIKFNTPTFKGLHERFSDLIIRDTKGGFSDSVTYNDIPYEYALGGIHGCIKSGSYIANDEFDIVDIDVISFYPMLAIRNKWYPKHLGEDFCYVYENLFNERSKYPKGTPENYGIKIALNASYGKSNSKFSWLYDPLFTMSITINGQLLITMLIEDVTEYCKILQANTDGITVAVRRKDRERLSESMNKWEQLTGLTLETADYASMHILNVNNYMAVSTKGKIKLKGEFEIDKAWHKDHSMRVVPIAVARNLIHNIPVEKTVYEHMNMTSYDDLIIDGSAIKAHGIYDFCKAVRGDRNSEFRYIGSDGNKPLTRTTRYHMSRGFGAIIKSLPQLETKETKLDIYRKNDPKQLDIFSIVEDVLDKDVKRESYVEAQGNVRIFNDYHEPPYDIDHAYYIRQANRIIKQIKGNEN